MNSGFEQTAFSKCVLSGLCAGITASISCLIYDSIYRYYTGFILSTLINVSTIIFVINFLFLIFGLLYFALKNAIKKGGALYIALFIVLTVFSLWKAGGVQRSSNPEWALEFRTLLSGIIIIVGICGAIVIPLLFNNKKFEKYVL